VIQKASGGKRSVLFVCTANQCRSPMAMVLFEDLVKRQKAEPKKWRIESAGVWAPKGYPATDLAIKAMGIISLDLNNHRSQPVTEFLLHGFNLILCMENGQKSFLKQNYPNLHKDVFLLSEMADKNTEIQDPVGCSLEVYIQIANEMLFFNGKRISKNS
jgi:ribose 5-phosphate isomerase B